MVKAHQRQIVEEIHRANHQDVLLHVDAPSFQSPGNFYKFLLPKRPLGGYLGKIDCTNILFVSSSHIHSDQFEIPDVLP